MNKETDRFDSKKKYTTQPPIPVIFCKKKILLREYAIEAGLFSHLFSEHALLWKL